MDSPRFCVCLYHHRHRMLCALCFVFLLNTISFVSSSCNFHDMKHIETVDVIWETNNTIRPNGNDLTEIEFKKNYMIARHIYQTPFGTNNTEQYYIRECIYKMMDKYVVRHEEKGKPRMYACLEFIRRGVAIMQIRESNFVSRFDLQLCHEHHLKLNPWPLILRSRIRDEYLLCPLQGGYNMKTVDSNGISNGCNMKALPMRLESECIAGEGMTFYFRSETCLQNTPMETTTNLLCVASWWDDGYTFTIVRTYKGQIWCLRSQNISNWEKTEIYLFFDLICPNGVDDIIGWSETSNKAQQAKNYIVASLTRVLYTKLCQDEYKECRQVVCSRLTDYECPYSCRKCDPNIPPAVCSFPSRLRGPWYQTNYDGIKEIQISESNFEIERVGSFKCVSLSRISTRSEGRYSVLSIFENGCRPRYSCIQITDYSPMVMGYVLSKSIVWPLIDDHVKDSICSNQRFVSDVKPIGDTYRSFPNSFKPIVSRKPLISFKDCEFESSFEIRLAIKPGRGCYGSMYQDCYDNTLCRIEMKNCPIHAHVSDYRCLLTFKPNYWEKAVVMQNRDNTSDTICLLRNDMHKNEIMVMAASECNKMTWSFVRGRYLKPLTVYTIKAEAIPCKNIPMRTTTTADRIIIHKPQTFDRDKPNDPFKIPSVPDIKEVYRKRKADRKKEHARSNGVRLVQCLTKGGLQSVFLWLFSIFLQFT
ncbi:Hypothetical predicted protein [Octopus vulgaris]|uniref:DUF7043 domain-containing protein n=1 Tax=Octopus vulgaris TaxID=6645 RepID=A0AA36AYG2_OCTVU|nr:Hypothetical predicted protein [Octopus vulgaris]